MTGRRQREEFIRTHQDPTSLPVGRFMHLGGRKVRCVLCGRDGFGPLAFDPAKTYPTRSTTVHRKLLAFIGDRLLQVEGPDAAPPAPRPVPWWAQFSPWQIDCFEDHVWPCSCGLLFRRYVDLWRHIGADRPAGWGRQGEHHPVLFEELAS